MTLGNTRVRITLIETGAVEVVAEEGEVDDLGWDSNRIKKILRECLPLQFQSSTLKMQHEKKSDSILIPLKLCFFIRSVTSMMPRAATHKAPAQRIKVASVSAAAPKPAVAPTSDAQLMPPPPAPTAKSQGKSQDDFRKMMLGQK
jgi:hypothetical protein